VPSGRPRAARMLASCAAVGGGPLIGAGRGMVVLCSLGGGAGRARSCGSDAVAVLTGPSLPAPRHRAGGARHRTDPARLPACRHRVRSRLMALVLPGRRPGDPGAPHRRGPGVLDPGPDDRAPARRRAVRCGGHGRVHPVSLQSGGDPRVVRGLPRHRDRRPGRRRRIRRARRPRGGAGPRPVGRRRLGRPPLRRARRMAAVRGHGHRPRPAVRPLPSGAGPAQTTEASSPSSPVSSYGA
jgi:hypothetical protein